MLYLAYCPTKQKRGNISTKRDILSESALQSVAKWPRSLTTGPVVILAHPGNYKITRKTLKNPQTFVQRVSYSLHPIKHLKK